MSTVYLVFYDEDAGARENFNPFYMPFAIFSNRVKAEAYLTTIRRLGLGLDGDIRELEMDKPGPLDEVRQRYDPDYGEEDETSYQPREIETIDIEEWLKTKKEEQNGS